MVTVAKSLDVPIKLMFPRPGAADEPPDAPPSHAMLGLGDVVLPGIMIGLALRFDLYLFYLRQQKRIPSAAPGVEDGIEKPQYHSFAGRWTDYFWTHSLTGRPLWTSTTTPDIKPESPFTFPKTYFNAGLVGYILGLLATLGVMMVWNHAQPALLYLVPGVLGSIWLTALVRGELSLMWSYTEEIEDEEQSKSEAKVKESPLHVEGGQKAGEAARDEINGTLDGEASQGSEAKPKSDHHPQPQSSRKSDREAFSFSIEAPWPLKKPSPTHKEAAKEDALAKGEEHHDGGHNWVPSKTASRAAETEPSGKRVRLK